MSYLTDFIGRIRRWIDDEDEYDDATITEWIRDAEERMNNELRSVEQVTRDYATFNDNCALLPPNWLEHLYVRPQGGRPLDYVTPRDYWNLTNPPPYSGTNPNGEAYPWPNPKALYTTIGQTLFVWPPIDPNALTKFEVAFFRSITPLGDVKDPVMDRYPAIYRYCTLSAAAPYMIEDERLQTWATLATAGIEKANFAARAARWSGSPIAPMIRGFG